MKLPLATPELSGSARAREARRIRELASEISRLNPQALTRTNGEEADHRPIRDELQNELGGYPANFTKGLLHNVFGMVMYAEDYRNFVAAINSHDTTLFETLVRTAQDRRGTDLFLCTKGEKTPSWRGWESPRSGHVFEMQGPDAGAVGMAPAPRVGSSELAAEMAEVYALALLRDVPFTVICEGGSKKLCASGHGSDEALISADEAASLLNSMEFFSGIGAKSSTPHQVNAHGLNRFEANRREARFKNGTLTPEVLFRGSTKGAKRGPYISQFMLIGNDSFNSSMGATGMSNFPGTQADFDFRDGFIRYGSLIIDQRTFTHLNCVDYMTDWCSWLDVQNGASYDKADLFEEKRRFITTPRDLATYVHFDALYEAYLNAALILIAMEIPKSKGFPEPSPTENRTPFATFGAPHVLSLVTEVATRCLKAVRRQKFNYHRRARPEAMGGRFTIARIEEALGEGLIAGKSALGCTKDPFAHMLKEIPNELQDKIIEHNQEQNEAPIADVRRVQCDAKCVDNLFEELNSALGKPIDFDIDPNNLLLPMAFPEGSPMHPSYGAGHATVAGGCVTILKAFFEMYEDCDGTKERKLAFKDQKGNQKPIVYVPNDDGTALVKGDIKDDLHDGFLTIQGELDKLAANISIGRNMAGVHYYSDYYDSVRMGERIAVGILLEQAPTYGEEMSCTFKSFDGDLITISGNAGNCPTLSILDHDGNPVQTDEWWLRHTSGESFIEDF